MSSARRRTTGVLSLIFGTGNPQEVALGFLASSRYDAEIEKKSASGELADLLQIDLRDRPPRQRPSARDAGPTGPPRPADRSRGRSGRRRCPPRCPRSRSPPHPPPGTPARNWPAPGGCAGTCGTATSPPPARSSRSLPWGSSTSTPARSPRSRPSRAWSGPCSDTSRRRFWKVPLTTCSTWPRPGSPGSGPRSPPRSRLTGHCSPPPPRCCWRPIGSPRR